VFVQVISSFASFERVHVGESVNEISISPHLLMVRCSDVPPLLALDCCSEDLECDVLTNRIAPESAIERNEV
jgi:hypothetical protein